MKALVLAAGLGTRLRPHSLLRPKPLFPVGGRPVLARLIEQLRRAGCTALSVNAHHRAEDVAALVAGTDWGLPVTVCREPEILGTGGAIRRLADFWEDAPFLVVNGDIVTDIDLAAVYRRHQGHPDPATLVMTDCAGLNTVVVGPDDTVECLRGGTDPSAAPADGRRRLTFTGIQVLDPEVLDFLPPGGFAGSIEAFERMQAAGRRLRACCLPGAYWVDIGTPERYRQAAAEALIPAAFAQAHGRAVGPAAVAWEPLAGDGSDRRWYRLRAEAGSLILADHGLRPVRRPAEVDAFTAIGTHLHRRGVPVPALYGAEPFAGQVLIEDLGDCHLETVATRDRSGREALYRRAIDVLVHMHRAGARGFDPAWCHQRPRYDATVVVEQEGGYFLESYVRAVAGRTVDTAALIPCFAHLARGIERFGCPGFLHRDFQSRNLMLAHGRIRVIDFQGGRIGPLQYDLASLLIDPYVDLPEGLERRLRDDTARRLAADGAARPEDFVRGYQDCALARNLQILGAFGFLTRVRGKPAFASAIAPALAGLKRRLARRTEPELGPLRALVATL